MKNGTWNISMNKELIASLFSIILIVLFIGSVLGVTASIGNARMILRAQVGDTIQKTILVRNINNETVNIEITASGDLEKDIKILDNNFTLAAGEEKDAKFTIKVTKNGAFENKILVKFFSPTEGKGVALSSNVVVMVNGENPDELNETDGDNPDVPIDPDNPGNPDEKKSNPIMLLLSITGIILLIFFIVLIVYYIKNNKNSGDGINNDMAGKVQEEKQVQNKFEVLEEKKRIKDEAKHKKRADKK